VKTSKRVLYTTAGKVSGLSAPVGPAGQCSTRSDDANMPTGQDKQEMDDHDVHGMPDVLTH
jgi:hypothetical protein